MPSDYCGRLPCFSLSFMNHSSSSSEGKWREVLTTCRSPGSRPVVELQQRQTLFLDKQTRSLKVEQMKKSCASMAFLPKLNDGLTNTVTPSADPLEILSSKSAEKYILSGFVHCNTMHCNLPIFGPKKLAPKTRDLRHFQIRDKTAY